MGKYYCRLNCLSTGQGPDTVLNWPGRPRSPSYSVRFTPTVLKQSYTPTDYASTNLLTVVHGQVGSCVALSTYIHATTQARASPPHTANICLVVRYIHCYTIKNKNLISKELLKIVAGQ